MAISESTTEELLVEQKGQIVVITLNRPERMNAISRHMLDELSNKMTEANKDPEVRCIVLTGNGRGFCAGLDLVDAKTCASTSSDWTGGSDGECCAI